MAPQPLALRKRNAAKKIGCVGKAAIKIWLAQRRRGIAQGGGAVQSQRHQALQSHLRLLNLNDCDASILQQHTVVKQKIEISPFYRKNIAFPQRVRYNKRRSNRKDGNHYGRKGRKLFQAAADWAGPEEHDADGTLDPVGHLQIEHFAVSQRRLGRQAGGRVRPCRGAGRFGIVADGVRCAHHRRGSSRCPR